MDQQDPLKQYREQFHFPTINGQRQLYFCGNSLGLQPKSVKEHINVELEDWANWGVEGHFDGRNPWFHYHKFFTEKMAKVVGAKEEEVVVFNTLTTNLHLMMVSFYRPTKQRYKIMIEGGAFPSDYYAVESQIKFHGFEYDDACIELVPREGEDTLRTEDILAKIEEHKDDLALVMIGGVNYYTGQFYDLEAITKKGHEIGAKVGFDLAHAAGNIRLRLHDWGPDFAVWCTYKYLNSGPGGPGGCFVHERHANNPDLPRFAGWWGYDEESRFMMEPGFKPQRGAAGWQLSNAQVFAMAPLKASLEIFDEAGMDEIVAKRDKLTGYLNFLINDINNGRFKIITPQDQKDRGAQLSMSVNGDGKTIHKKIMEQNVIVDFREPNVIRLAPAPLYNSFEDVYLFVQAIDKAFE
jgi:kynureninase